MKRILGLLAVVSIFGLNFITDDAYAQTPPLRVNGVQFGTKDNSVYITAKGAKCDGSTDDSTAIQNAINAVATNYMTNGYGGVVHFPGGVCNFATPLNLHSLHNIILRGAGSSTNSSSPSNGATTLVYTGTGSTAAVQMYAAISTVVQDIAITYSSGSFTGILLDYGQHSESKVGQNNVVERVYLGNLGQSAWSADALIDLSESYGNVVRDSHIGYGGVGVRFRNSTTNASNANQVIGNWFTNLTVAGVANSAFGNAIVSNVFEPNNVGAPTTMYPAYKDTLGSAPSTEKYKCVAFAFQNNWVGDGDGSTYVFDNNLVPIYGGIISGNMLGGKVHFASMSGVKVVGNTFAYTGNNITFDGGGTYVGNALAQNTFTQTMAFVSAPNQGFSRVGNQILGTANTNDWLDIEGEIFASGNLIMNPITQYLFQVNGTTKMGFDGGTLFPWTTLTVGMGSSGGIWTEVWGRHFAGGGTSPTKAAGSCIGGTQTVTLDAKASDSVGTITLTGTAGGTASATCATVTFNTSWGTAPHCQITPANAAAAALSGTGQLYVDSASTTTSAFVIKVGSTLLPAGTYIYSYDCMQ